MLHEMYDGLMVMDFFDDCIIGIVKGIDNQDKVCYSYRKVIAKLMREDDMTEEDAMEHFYYNMMGFICRGKHSMLFIYLREIISGKKS